MKKQRVLCLDFCETLTPEITIRWADRTLLTSDGQTEMSRIRERLLPKLTAGTITRPEMEAWATRTFEIYAELGVTRSQVENAMHGFPLREGIRDLLESAKEIGLPVAIISGSCADFIELALGELSQLVTSVYATRMVYRDDQVMGAQPATSVTNFNKGECAQHFAHEHGAAETDIIAVGDSRNDDLLACGSGHLIGIAPDENRASKIRHFNEVHITATLHPVLQSIRRIAN